MSKEGKLQKKVLARARQEKIFAHKVVSESYSGFPDTLFIRNLEVPRLVNYELVMLELKAEADSRRSNEQIKIGNQLLELGVNFHFTHEYDFVCELLGIKS